jgi:hypothetical protein
VLALAVVGAIWQRVGQMMDARLAPPRSEIAAVGRRKVCVACIGTGRETFVLDSGLGGWSVFWWHL